MCKFTFENLEIYHLLGLRIFDPAIFFPKNQDT